MKLNLFKRSMIFATFFGACLCIALIVASLGTTHWIDARARRTANPLQSVGVISFGLFEGRKEIDYGYGLRTYDISIKAGTHPARRWAWCGTAGQLGAALVSAGGACVLAALGSAARHRCSPKPLLIGNSLAVKAGTHPARRWAWCGTAGQLGAALVSAGGACVLAALGSAARHRCSPKPLLIGNSLAVLFSLGAISVWLTEYFLRLQYNVMSDEDLANTWTSDGMADLGLSFWLVVGAAVAAMLNIICIGVAAADGRHADTTAPALEEKVNGAIMLY